DPRVDPFSRRLPHTEAVAAPAGTPSVGKTAQRWADQHVAQGKGPTSMQQTIIAQPGAAAPAAQTLVLAEQLTRIITTRAQKTVILDDVTFHVPVGCLFAVNGPSGSGKSTLLNLLTGIDRPTSGRIVFAGEELRALSEDGLARWRGRHVGIIFQFFQLV